MSEFFRLEMPNSTMFVLCSEKTYDWLLRDKITGKTAGFGLSVPRDESLSAKEAIIKAFGTAWPISVIENVKPTIFYLTLEQ